MTKPFKSNLLLSVVKKFIRWKLWVIVI
jgi:hypothetical protein